MLDLAFNEDQIAIADAIARFCESRCDDSVVKGLTGHFSSPLWRELAEMGAFMPATPEGEGGALEICAMAEVLGHHVFPGPLVPTYVATQILSEDERLTVMEGHTVVSLGEHSNNKQTLMPFAEQAKIFLLTNGEQLYRADVTGKAEPVATLGGDPWGRITLKAGPAFANSQRALNLGRIVMAAYLAAAGKRMVKDASNYANVRKQFGKALSEFQGLAHPLADCQTNLTAAETLARAAASCFDANDMSTASHYALGAQVSATRAALKAAYVAHQSFAAIGITLEGPAFHVSRRIRQLASQAPAESAARELLIKQAGLGT